MNNVFLFLSQKEKTLTQVCNQFFYNSATGRSQTSITFTGTVYFLDVDDWNQRKLRRYNHTLYSVDSQNGGVMRTKMGKSSYNPLCVQVRDSLFILVQETEKIIEECMHCKSFHVYRLISQDY